MKTEQQARRGRTTRFAIAAVALACGFVLTVVESRGPWQFTWNPQSLLAQPAIEEGTYDLSSIVVLNRVLLQLQENYVDADRFSPRWMLASGLNEIQDDVAEIVATFDRPMSEGPQEVVLHVGKSEKRFRFGDIESLWEMSLKFKEMFRFVQEHLGDEIDPHEIEYAAINGLLKTLDPHSILLSPEIYRDMLEGNRGNFGGLGIIIRMLDGRLTVVKPMGQDTPAVKAGVKKGDIIVQIEEFATLNMDVSEAVALLRGEPGTLVKLMIMRESEGWREAKPFEIMRDEIKIESVESADLGDKIAYVKLKGFQGNTHKDMVAQIDALSKTMGGLAGLVLDLRGNPGGLLEQAIQITDEFLVDGTIVTTVGSGRRYRKPYPAHSDDTQPSYPIVVLINSSSASASEIVAGALKNYGRALLLGDTSFGKGSVQVLYELQDGSALKLTIAQYLTPGDVSIQSVGIVPDIKLVPMTIAEGAMDIALKRWVRRESTLQSHLVHENATSDEVPAVVLKYVARANVPDTTVAAAPIAGNDAAIGTEPAAPTVAPEAADEAVSEAPGDSVHEGLDDELEEDDEPRPEQDPQVRVAKDLLLGAGDTWEKTELLERLEPALKEISNREDALLTKHLSALDVDWQAGVNPTKPALDVQLATSHPDNRFASGEEVILTVTVTNKGDQPLYRIFGVTDATTRYFEDIEMLFGRIEPGESISRSHTVTLRSNQRARHDLVSVAISANGRSLSDEILGEGELVLTTDGPGLPHFAFSYAVLDPKGNGDSMAAPTEDVTLRVIAENVGDGVAEHPVAYLRNLNGAAAALLEGRVEAAEMPPGGRQAYDFVFRAGKTESETFDFEFHIYDKTLGRAVAERVRVPAGTANKAPIAASGSAVARKDSVSLRVAPTDTAPLNAKLPANVRVQVLAQAGEWMQLRSAEVVGWAPRAQLQLTEEAVETPGQLALTYAGYAPKVTLEALAPATQEATITLHGTAEDDEALRDLYVFVYSENDHVNESRKVAYRRLSGTRDDFELEVPLAKGMNRIKLTTRDADEMEVTDSVYILRQ